MSFKPTKYLIAQSLRPLLRLAGVQDAAQKISEAAEEMKRKKKEEKVNKDAADNNASNAAQPGDRGSADPGEDSNAQDLVTMEDLKPTEPTAAAPSQLNGKPVEGDITGATKRGLNSNTETLHSEAEERVAGSQKQLKESDKGQDNMMTQQGPNPTARQIRSAIQQAGLGRQGSDTRSDRAAHTPKKSGHPLGIPPFRSKSPSPIGSNAVLSRIAPSSAGKHVGQNPRVASLQNMESPSAKSSGGIDCSSREKSPVRWIDHPYIPPNHQTTAEVDSAPSAPDAAKRAKPLRSKASAGESSKGRKGSSKLAKKVGSSVVIDLETSGSTDARKDGGADGRDTVTSPLRPSLA